MKKMGDSVDDLGEDIEDLKKPIQDLPPAVDGAGAGVDKGNKKMIASFKKVGLAIGAAFSVAAITRFAKESVRLADIQLKAEAKLLTALKGRQDIQQRLIKQASDLQKETLFGDEATINAQALLASLGLNEQAITRLIPLVQDLATKSGMDLSSTADLIAKSVGSSTNALSRYGVVITGAVGSSERLESAISSLNEQVGGQAVAAANAGAGGIVKLQNAVGDLQEETGKAILEGLVPFADLLQDIAENEEVLDFFKRFGQFIGTTLSLITDSIRGWELFFKALDGGKSAQKALAEQSFDQIVLNRQLKKDALDLAVANGESTIKVSEARNEYRKYNNEFLRRINLGRDRSKQIKTENDEIVASADAAAEAAGITDESNKKLLTGFTLLKKEIGDAQKAIDLIDPTINPAGFNAAVQQLQALIDKLEELNQAAKDAVIGENISAEISGIVDSIALDADIDLGELITIDPQVAKDAQDAVNEARREGREADAADALKLAQETANKRRDISATSLQTIGSFAQEISNFRNALAERELQALQEKLDQGLISEKQFEKEKAEIQRKQAQQQKANAIFTAIVNGAAGIVSQFQAGPAGIALAAIVAALTAAQIAVIAAQPIPKFAEGTRSVELNGAPKGKDTVLARLTEGERVVTVRDNKKHWKLYNAIEDNNKEAMMEALAGYGIPVQFKTTYEELYKPMTALQQLSSSKDKGIDWNPLLRSNERGRHSSGRKLDRIYEELVNLNTGLTRKMTRA